MSFYYWYFGEDAIELPDEYSEVVAIGRPYKKLSEDRCTNVINWVGCHYEMGQHGLPYKWTESNEFVRFKGE